MRHLSWSVLLILVAFSATSCKSSWENMAFAFKPAEKQIQTTLTPHADKYKKGEPVMVSFTVSNFGEKAVRVCRWNSPLEGSYADDFLLIERKKKVAEFKGETKARKQSFFKSFVSLKPGESITQTIDLSEAYDLEKKGTYSISFEGDAYNRLPDSEPIEIKIK
ncbi:MAG: hypothetical protein MRZ79_04920 [Bacteroidia bacterium]|nr:hypothetical protein [Bacteroidia bacterium]